MKIRKVTKKTKKTKTYNVRKNLTYKVKREGNSKISLQKATPSARQRNWAFTWNNYTAENIKMIADSDEYQYTFQEEVCPKTGTPHLQGFLAYTNKQSFDTVRKFLSGAHVTPMDKSLGCNIKYCTKKESSTGKMHSNMKKVLKFMEKNLSKDQKTKLFQEKLRLSFEKTMKELDQDLEWKLEMIEKPINWKSLDDMRFDDAQGNDGLV